MLYLYETNNVAQTTESKSWCKPCKSRFLWFLKVDFFDTSIQTSRWLQRNVFYIGVKNKEKKTAKQKQTTKTKQQKN